MILARHNNRRIVSISAPLAIISSIEEIWSDILYEARRSVDMLNDLNSEIEFTAAYFAEFRETC